MPGLTVLCGRQRTVSDAEGRFTCGDLGPGPLTVEAFGRGHHGVLARPVNVSIATVVTDLRLEVARTAFAARGRVTAGGAPVEGAAVEAGERQASTDEAGRYLLADLPAGTYEISVRTGVLIAAQPRPLVVSDRDVEQDLEIGVRTDLLVEVVDTSGKPIEKQEVSLEQALDDSSAIGASEPTDAMGQVRFRGLLATRAKLSGPGLPTGTVDLRTPHSRPLRLVAQESGRLQGRVHAPPGTSIAERRVCAEKDGDSSRCEDTGPDGSFSFAALAPGRYRVEARSGRVWSSAQPAEATAEADVRKDATSEVVLEVPADDAELAGRVLDAAGRPVDDALVIYFMRGLRSFSAGSWALGGGVDVAVTTADGRFRFTRVRPHLDYELEALTRQGRRGRAPVAIDGETTIRLPD
jgi:protocatechuate 3,4-dioxygenase beta subunit